MSTTEPRELNMNPNQLAQLAALLVANADGIKALFAALDNSCAHTASDVAQDALDAWEHGNLTSEQCAAIMQIILKPHVPAYREPQLPKLPVNQNLAPLAHQFLSIFN